MQRIAVSGADKTDLDLAGSFQSFHGDTESFQPNKQKKYDLKTSSPEGKDLFNTINHRLLLCSLSWVFFSLDFSYLSHKMLGKEGSQFVILRAHFILHSIQQQQN